MAVCGRNGNNRRSSESIYNLDVACVCKNIMSEARVRKLKISRENEEAMAGRQISLGDLHRQGKKNAKESLMSVGIPYRKIKKYITDFFFA